MDIGNGDSFIVDSSLKIGHVHLKVSNLEKSIKFYQSALGFKVTGQESSTMTVFLASNTIEATEENLFSPLLAITQVNDTGNISNHKGVKKAAGLYHFAILLPERRFLASFLRHLQKNIDSQYFEGMADHGVSESIYIHDPDLNGVEIYSNRLPSKWKWSGDKVHMVTEPLDVKDMLIQTSSYVWNGLPSNTSIGHVHLRVSNLNNSRGFYRDMLGFHQTVTYPGAYFFAADSYHHHVAINTWIGTNILPAYNDDKPGLDHYAVMLSNHKDRVNRLKNYFTSWGISVQEAMLDSYKPHPSSLYVYDPYGIKIQFLLK